MKAGINRRQFMQKSLVGAAAAPLVTHVLAHEAEASTQAVSPQPPHPGGPHRCGGPLPPEVGLLDAAVAVPGVEVIGVCDAYKGRVHPSPRESGRKAKDYGDYRTLLADKSIDAVVIATPDHWHKAMTLDALAAGKDVYLEKPMTLTIDEGPEMYAAAEKAGRILQIGSNGMSSKLQETAHEIVKSASSARSTSSARRSTATPTPAPGSTPSRRTPTRRP